MSYSRDLMLSTESLGIISRESLTHALPIQRQRLDEIMMSTSLVDSEENIMKVRKRIHIFPDTDPNTNTILFKIRTNIIQYLPQTVLDSMVYLEKINTGVRKNNDTHITTWDTKEKTAKVVYWVYIDTIGKITLHGHVFGHVINISGETHNKITAIEAYRWLEIGMDYIPMLIESHRKVNCVTN